MHESSCPHVITIGDWSPEDIADKVRGPDNYNNYNNYNYYYYYRK